MAFINDLHNDEIRDGFLVMADRKKVWNRQLEIWQEIDRICRKHNIKYHAIYGTLLGAVRHKGFIPWDDDMDVCMLRPEFNRFYEIVDDELKGSIFEIRVKTSSAIAVSHSQTTGLIRKDLTDKTGSKGLLVDVFSMDIAPDGTKDGFSATNAINELMGTIYNFPALVEHANKGRRTLNDWSVIEGLHAVQDRAKQFEFLNVFAEGLFDWSKTVNWLEYTCKDMTTKPYQKAWFDETIYLPFESVELPAPAAYDEILTTFYGDWRKFVWDRRNKLGILHSADIPYKEILERADLDFMFPQPKDQASAPDSKKGDD